MTYSEKLQMPQWQKRRLEILTLAEWKCQNCPSTQRSLHVHHRYYVRGRDPWDYPDDSLMALCDACHEEAHKEREHLDMALSVLPLGTADMVAFALDRLLDSAADADELSLRLRSWMACTGTFDLCLKAKAIMEGRE